MSLVELLILVPVVEKTGNEQYHQETTHPRDNYLRYVVVRRGRGRNVVHSEIMEVLLM